jgi:hypothetical protein
MKVNKILQTYLENGFDKLTSGAELWNFLFVVPVVCLPFLHFYLSYPLFILQIPACAGMTNKIVIDKIPACAGMTAAEA